MPSHEGLGMGQCKYFILKVKPEKVVGVAAGYLSHRHSITSSPHDLTGGLSPFRHVATPTVTSYCRSGNTSIEVKVKVRVRDSWSRS